MFAGLMVFAGCDGGSGAGAAGGHPGGSGTTGSGAPSIPDGEVALDAIEEWGGVWFRAGDSDPFAGTAVRRFKGGAMAESGEFKSGKRDGKTVEWLKGGTKKRETLYRDGEAYFQTVWRNDGSKKIETGMEGDVPHGPHKRWYASGKLGFVGAFYEGQFHGLIEDRDEQGKLLMKVRYEKGVKVEDLIGEQ